MKKACRARDQSEPIHPNANDPAAAAKEPTAKFDVIITGTSEEVAWARDSTPPVHLSSISVFDSKCARSYITAEQDVAYLPYGLDIVENLANQVLPRLAEILEVEIEGLDISELPFEHLFSETEVGKVVKDLSVKSGAEEITLLGTLTEEDAKRITDLETALREGNPLAKAKEARLAAMRLKAYAELLTKPLSWVGPEAA